MSAKIAANEAGAKEAKKMYKDGYAKAEECKMSIAKAYMIILNNVSSELKPLARNPERDAAKAFMGLRNLLRGVGRASELLSKLTETKPKKQFRGISKYMLSMLDYNSHLASISSQLAWTPHQLGIHNLLTV